MNDGSERIANWLERKRRTDRAWAAGVAVLALAFGAGIFLLTTGLIYSVIQVVSFSYRRSNLLSLVALGLTTWSYAHIIKRTRETRELYLDPAGWWIVKEFYSAGPRLLLEGFSQIRRCAQLGELDVKASAGMLAYLARHNASVTREELMAHFAQVSWRRLKEQFLLLDGVLFLGEDEARITLIEPFRLWLRSMLPPEQTKARPRESARPRSGPAPHTVPVNEPERLGAYEILGLSPMASLAEIKAAYRKRIRTCHPDLFADKDEQARALAERWTKALNAAYATLHPRQRTRDQARR